MSAKMYLLAKKVYMGFTWSDLEFYFFQSKKYLRAQMDIFFKGREDVRNSILYQIESNNQKKEQKISIDEER